LIVVYICDFFVTVDNDFLIKYFCKSVRKNSPSIKKSNGRGGTEQKQKSKQNDH
jgi:hypothetical protein